MAIITIAIVGIAMTIEREMKERSKVTILKMKQRRSRAMKLIIGYH